MKLILSVAAVAVAFFVVLLGGGSAVGVWEELNLPATSAAADQAVRTLAPSSTRKAPPKAEKRRSRVDEATAKANRAKRRWAAAANKLCRKAARETEVGAIESPRTAAEAEAVLARVAELNARYNDRLRLLEPPPRESGRITRLMALLDKEEAAVDRLLEAVQDRDPVRMNTARDRLVGIADRQSTIMYDLGAYDCAL